MPTTNTNLYVSTSLDYFQEPDDSPLDKDVVRDGVTYRRLDLPYLAWLNAQYEKLCTAVDAGKISGDIFDQVHEQIADVFEFAYKQMGRDRLIPLLRKVNLAGYVPPK